ncbi:3'-5' exonuclease [Rhodoferax antarcticus]|uniref:DNA 3'-5' helicase n=2 Tax=Rhodoferax antarcticus TaxID=81479 RepID=A0A1Q8YC78_9BURK|nr:ATP-dependent helicase [Rhodoferax antarcticus]APW46894.1 hypothetical protein RA876_11585 [Rhodoferax antarcticus]OLP05420.1 hypothetical protein BLL52_3549 [Rhodoferax antarcticus ANT.BR]
MDTHGPWATSTRGQMEAGGITRRQAASPTNFSNEHEDAFMTMATQILKTDEQKAICDSEHPLLVVEANAGAAKTTTAAMKINQLIAEGVDPGRIVALSFSAPGVQAYRDAFKRIGMSLAAAKAVQVGTFEDFCASWLMRLEGLEVKRPTRPEEVRAFVLAAIPGARVWASDRFNLELSIEGSGELAVEGLLYEFGEIKGSMQLLRQGEYFQISPECAVEIGRSFTTLAIYRAYEKQRCVSVDADSEQTKFRYSGDATYDLARILEADDPCFTWETNPLRLGLQAVFLDEMHDTNWAMFTVLKQLLQFNQGASFLGVGDRDQVIHAQHGADAYFMGEGFDTYIGKPERLPLTESYRFGGAISQPLAGFSAKNYAANRAHISRVEVKKTGSALDVLALINHAMTARPGLQPDSPKSQLAVLLRNPSASVELEHALRERCIRYQTIDFTTYLERSEVLFVRLLLGWAVGLQEPFRTGIDALAKRATWAFLSANASVTAEEQTEKSLKVNGASLKHFLEYMLPDALGINDPRATRYLYTSVDDAVRRRICKAIDLAASDDIHCLAGVFDFLDIGNLARRVYVKEQEAEDARASVTGLLKASEKYVSISQFMRSLMAHDYEARAARFAGDRIILSSIEAVKGLEFEHVIVPDVNATDFDGDSRDERNLFYVAASRAKTMLTLTYRAGHPSSYLRHFESN